MMSQKWLVLFAIIAAPGTTEAKQSKDRTPPKRMKRLVKFAKQWLEDNIKNNESSPATKKFRVALHDRLLNKIENKTKKMLEVYGKTNDDGERRCGYYDPSTTYGGPQIEAPELNDKKKLARKEYLESQRGKRHQLITELHTVDLTPKEWHHIRRDEDLNHIEEKIMELEDWFRNQFDDVVNLEENYNRHRRAPKANLEQGKVGTADLRFNEDDPITGWKQISTGFRKWAERYIAFCSAEYKDKRFSKWATETVSRKIELVYRCKILGQDREGCKN